MDAANGKVLEKINLLKDAAGKGRIFDPNPVVKLNNTTLKDSSPIPAAAYSDVTLNALDNTGTPRRGFCQHSTHGQSRQENQFEVSVQTGPTGIHGGHRLFSH